MIWLITESPKCHVPVSARSLGTTLLPKIPFANLPRPVWELLMARVAVRQIGLEDLGRLQEWVRTAPHAPEGDWSKDFGSFLLCGGGKFPKTVLLKGMAPYGQRLK